MAKAQTITYREPSVRAVSTWSPPAVRAALSLMQYGNFSQAAYLADAVLGDDRVQAVLGTRINGVLGLPLEFTPSEDKSRSKQVAETLKADFWDILPEDVAAEVMLYGQLLGACVAELVWIPKEDRIIPELKVWHPSLLSFDQQERVWKVRLESGEMPITPGDGKWFLFAPNGSRRPWTKALVRALAIPWLAKLYAVGDWNRYSEVLGGAVKQGNVPAGAQPGDKEAFKSDLKNLASDGVVIVPEGYGFELVEAQGKGSETFQHLIDWADKAFAVATLGQNLTTDVEGGSYAAAAVHNSVRQDLIEADTEGLATALHDQVLTWWAEFNFGDKSLAPWPDWNTLPPPEDGKVYKYHLDYGVLTVNEIRGKLGLPPTEGGDAIPQPVRSEEGGVRSKSALRLTPHTSRLTNVRLASGDDPSEADGFVQGQLYADAVADRSRRRGAVALGNELAAMLTAIEEAEDYDQLRQNLLELYEDMEPEELAEVTEKALILADLAGRLAVHEDT